MYKERETQQTQIKQRPYVSIHVFDSLGKVIEASKRLWSIGYKNKSSLYYDKEKNTYYLFLENASVKELRFAFVNEYSSTARASYASYIKEHCQCARYHDAVSKFAQI